MQLYINGYKIDFNLENYHLQAKIFFVNIFFRIIATIALRGWQQFLLGLGNSKIIVMSTNIDSGWQIIMNLMIAQSVIAQNWFISNSGIWKKSWMLVHCVTSSIMKYSYIGILYIANSTCLTAKSNLCMYLRLHSLSTFIRTYTVLHLS